MNEQIKKISISVLAALIVSLTGSFASIAYADDDAVKNVELRLEGACDSENSRLWLINNHTSKSIIAKLRWSLANSKRVISDQFQVAASAKLEIGCAAKADIVSAQYAPS